MNELIQTDIRALKCATDEQIVEACHKADYAEDEASWQGFIAGVMLLEKRHQMANGGLIHGRNQHSGGGGFLQWLTELKISKTKAYRWMDCAGRIIRARLKLTMEEQLIPFIRMGERMVSCSEVLTQKTESLPAEALEFRESLMTFLEDRTLGGAAQAASCEYSPPHHITRAANGKINGGTHAHDDRKAYDQFVVVKLSQIATHLKHWDTMDEAQRVAIQNAFSAFCAGDELKVRFQKPPVKFALPPDELCKVMVDALKERLTNTPGR
jgi:hypothetical protein